MSTRDGLGHVVVVGGGFAGLLTARALAGHAGRVTVVDRDHMPDTPQNRPGVPQSRHIHVVLAGGQRALESLLPGVLDELASRGVPAVAHPRDILQLNLGQWVPRWGDSVSLLTGTRSLVEHVVRARVLSHPRIDMLESTEVVGLHGDATRVRGVLVRARGSDASTGPTVLSADLVIDASGRGSRTPRWLPAIGGTAPAEERIETGLGYATRLYRADADPAVADYRGIYLVPHPAMPRSAVVMPIEEPGTYLVTLSGLAGDVPPTDPEGFDAFARRLEHPVVSEWLAAAQPQGPPAGFRGTANVRRRYDRLAGPEGLLVVGDATAAFNPVYGQGISVAALAAVALRRALTSGERSVRRLQQIVTDAGEPAWSISGGVDRRMPGVTTSGIGSGPLDRPLTRFSDWYLDRVQRLSLAHQPVASAFRDVVHLLAPPESLFAWPVAWRVMFARVRAPLTQPPLLVGDD